MLMADSQCKRIAAPKPRVARSACPLGSDGAASRPQWRSIVEPRKRTTTQVSTTYQEWQRYKLIEIVREGASNRPLAKFAKCFAAGILDLRSGKWYAHIEVRDAARIDRPVENRCRASGDCGRAESRPIPWRPRARLHQR